MKLLCEAVFLSVAQHLGFALILEQRQYTSCLYQVWARARLSCMGRKTININT